MIGKFLEVPHVHPVVPLGRRNIRKAEVFDFRLRKDWIIHRISPLTWANCRNLLSGFPSLSTTGTKNCVSPCELACNSFLKAGLKTRALPITLAPRTIQRNCTEAEKRPQCGRARCSPRRTDSSTQTTASPSLPPSL